MAERYPVVVCDRSILDYVVYMKERFGGKDLGTACQNVMDGLERLALGFLPTYDLLVYLPLSGTRLKEDGTRSVDPGWQARVDAMFQTVLEEKSMPHLKLDTTAPDAEQLGEILKRLPLR